MCVCMYTVSLHFSELSAHLEAASRLSASVSTGETHLKEHAQYHGPALHVPGQHTCL